MNIVSIHNISKNFRSIQALKNVSFEVPEGSVFGVLGPNGSGKTTLLSILMEVLYPSSGTFQLFMQPPSHELRKKIGTLLETPNFYHYLSGIDNLKIVASIKGSGYQDIEPVLKKVNLWSRGHSKFSTYSLGMKQRLAIASALLINPSLLVLDEPTNGLDPVGIAEIRDLITSMANEGKTILLASHLLDEVEKVCTHVAILKEGNLLMTGSVREVLRSDDGMEIGADDMTLLKAIIVKFPSFKSLNESDHFLQVSFTGEISATDLNRFCFDQGITLNHLERTKKKLETRFLEITQ
ncbi:MAG TPA: ABC transporter ATP-binding protein [Chitinophagales bacterium]|nr:ABC transporter ATP-binding protein [Chitinophagales bacterium]